MASENSSNPREHFLAGKRFLREENMDRSLRAFEKAFKEDKDNADYMSYYGMLKAIRGGEIGLGLELCTRAIKKEFFKAEYYLNLGRVYMAAGNKKGAIKVFLKGLKFDPQNEDINKYLVELGFRGRPIIPGLDRANPINKLLGILLRRVIPGLFRKKES
ncbi:MAG: tetratricopeptide repeat protein [Deltaproteobacteria bacterium]|nr:tetratricopeptide repeat protein [Deltaproteobacteria bacterium]